MIMPMELPFFQEEKVEETKPASNNKCFNCLGDHMITDCPEPKDPKAIAKNRREFMSKNVSSVRYFFFFF